MQLPYGNGTEIIMKKPFIRIISLILCIFTVMPSIVACKDPQQPNEPGGPVTPPDETPKAFIDAVQTGYDTLPILSLNDQQTASKNGTKYNEKLTYIDGKSVYKWSPADASLVNIFTPEATDISESRYVEFSIYCESETDLEFTLQLDSLANDNNTPQVTIKVDFVGWQSYRVIKDSFSAKKPFETIEKVTLNYQSGSKNTPIYITDVNATTPLFELSVSEGVDVNDPSHYDAILDVYKEYKLGVKDAPDSDAYKTAINTIKTDCTTSWSLFKESCTDLNSPDTLFKVQVSDAYESGYGNPKKSGSAIAAFYQNVANMALGYALPDCEHFGKTELLDDIITALEYGYKHYYGEEMAVTGQTFGNWYSWDTTIPQHINTTLIMIKDSLTAEQISKYLSPHKKILYHPQGHGSNRMMMAAQVIFASALERDALRLASTLRLLEDVYIYQDKMPEGTPVSLGDGGVFSDGSFIQHGSVPYTGSYGNGLLSNIALISYYLKDTIFGLYFEAAENRYELVFNNYRPVIFGANLSASLLGRSITTATEGFTGMESARSALIMSTYAPEEYRARLLAFVKTVMVAGNSSYTRYMALPFIGLAEEVFADESIKPETDYVTAKVFGAMDRIVQHTPTYGVCLALSSTRITKYESINDANETGWYHGDGMLYIYTDDYDYGQWAHNWYANPYLMAGTTVNLAPRVDKPIWPMMYNTSPYAGGVAQGSLAVSGFILGYNRADFATTNSFESLEAMDITAKKSYFMFDNEIVCVGSDINDWSGHDVVTVVDNRIWGYRKSTPATDTLSVNGTPVSSPETIETRLDVRTMHFTNMGGYVFLRPEDGNSITYQKATRYPYETVNGANVESSRDFLEVTINHGKGNGSVDGKYFYAYLPEATAEQTVAYGQSPDVKLLKRNSSTHAVLEQSIGAIGCVFFEKDIKGFSVDSDSTAVKKISSDTLCSVLITKNENGETVISASDPTQEYKQIVFSVTLDHAPSVINADSGVTYTVEGNTVKVTVRTADSLGAGFTLTVK